MAGSLVPSTCSGCFCQNSPRWHPAFSSRGALPPPTFPLSDVSSGVQVPASPWVAPPPPFSFSVLGAQLGAQGGLWEERTDWTLPPPATSRLWADLSSFSSDTRRCRGHSGWQLGASLGAVV